MLRKVIKENFNKKNIQFLLLAVLCCFSILTTALQSITIIIFTFLSIFFNYRAIFKETKKRSLFLFFVIIFWVMALYCTILYSLEFSPGIRYFEKSINIIVIPFVILYCFPKLNKKIIKLLLKIYVISCTLFVFYLFAIIFENLSIEYLPELNNGNLIEKINIILKAPRSEILWYGLKTEEKNKLIIHKTYFSLNLSFAIIIALYLFLKKNNSFKSNIYWVLSCFIMALPILYFFSIINIIVLIIALGVLITLKIKTKKLKFISLILYLGCLIFSTNLFFNYIKKNDDILHKSVTSKLNFVLEGLNISETSKKHIDTRALINDCSKNLFFKKPIFGYGLGEQHIHLSGCYAQNKKFFLVEMNYNTHNFYYFLLLSGGFFVFLPFIYMIYYLFKHAFISKNYLLIIFLSLVFLNLFIENLLSRINGILFFSILLPLLLRFKEEVNKKN